VNAIERKQSLLNILKEKSSESVSNLSDLLGVSMVTIRADLDDLERKGLILRTHGGACIAERYQDIRKIANTLKENEGEKKKIASLAASLINTGATIIIDAGSTTAYLAAMVRDMSLTVITNSLPVVRELSSSETVEVLISCGALRKSSQSVIGAAARFFFDQINADILFLGASGFSILGGISCTNLVEAETKRLMMARSMKVCLLADSSKLEKVYMAHLCGWDGVDAFVTDFLPEESRRILEEKGVEVLTDSSRSPGVPAGQRF
jgi:DeoR family fructose operon transcriptional repressor